MFKPKSDAIRIGQDSLLIPCKNGNQFTEDQIIRFEIPRNVGFADFANSYLEMEVELKEANPTNLGRKPPLMLNPVVGASSLIDRLIIRSEGRVLEELDGYAVYANLHYNATDTEGNRNKRSLLEGCAKSKLIQDNPWCQKNSNITPSAVPAGATGLITAQQGWQYVKRKVCLPLLGGIFRNPKAHPCIAMPLEVEILCNKAVKTLRVVDDLERPHGGIACEDTGGAGAQNFLIVSQRGMLNSIGGATAQTPQTPIEGQGLLSSVCNLPFKVGQFVRVAGAGTIVAGNYEIANIDQFSSAAAGNQNRVRIQFTANVDGAGAGTGVTIHTLNANDTLLTQYGSVGYNITNPRLVVQKVIPPPSEIQAITRAIAKGNYSQDIISWTRVNNAIPASQTASTNIIPIDLTRVKSILSIPISQAGDAHNNSNALQGLYLDAERYQYQINNKLIPDRRVELAREQYPTIPAIAAGTLPAPYTLGTYHSGLHIWEAEKALRSANINVQNMNFLTKNNSLNGAANFTAIQEGCWFVGRSLASGVGSSQNLVNKNVVLYLDYRTTSNMVKLLNNFVVHIRTMTVGMDGVQVFY